MTEVPFILGMKTHVLCLAVLWANNNCPLMKKNAIINESIFIWNIDLKVKSQTLKRKYSKISFYQNSPQTIREKLDWDYTKEIKRQVTKTVKTPRTIWTHVITVLGGTSKDLVWELYEGSLK